MKKIILAPVLMLFMLSGYCSNTGCKIPAISIARGESAEDIAQKILDLINKGLYDKVPAYFSPEVKAKLTGAQLKDAWMGVQLEYGKILHCGRPVTTDVQGYKRVVFPINYEKGNANFELNFNDAAKVIGIWIKPVK
jgi:hypothetical protein